MYADVGFSFRLMAKNYIDTGCHPIDDLGDTYWLNVNYQHRVECTDCAGHRKGIHT